MLCYSGEPCIQQVYFDRSKKVSWVMFNDYKEILAHEEFIGSIDAKRFNQFVLEQCFHFLGEFPKDKHCILMLDGLKLHFNPILQEIIKEKGVFYFNFAKYSPHLNLTEPHIGIVKRKIKCRSNGRPSNVAELIWAISESIADINESKLDWYNYLARQGYQQVLNTIDWDNE